MNKEKPIIRLGNIWSQIENLPPAAQSVLYETITYDIPNADFIIQTNDRFKHWDGKKHLFQKTRNSNNQGKFLTGLAAKVIKALHEDFKVIPEIIDERIKPEQSLNLVWNDNIKIRDYQEQTVNDCLKKTRGVIEVATGGGKTLIAARLIHDLAVAPFIFYVLTKDLMEQAKERIQEYMNGVEVGLIGDGKCDIKEINVMTIQTAIRAYDKPSKKKKKNSKSDDFIGMDESDLQSLKEENMEHVKTKRKDIQDLIENAKAIYFDEAHHAAAKTCETIISKSNKCYYLFGGTATPTRTDNAELMLEGLFGRKIGGITASFLIKKGFLMKPDIYYINLNSRKTRVTNWEEDLKYNIIENQERNDHIIRIGNDFTKKKTPTLILVTRIDHGDYLQEKIEGSIFVHGKTNKRKELLDKVDRGEINTLISTSLPYDEKILIRNDNTGIIENIKIGEFTKRYLNVPGTKKVEGYSVLSLDKFNSDSNFHKLTHVHKKEKKVPIIEVCGNHNLVCEVTDNHSLITTKNQKDLIEFFPTKEEGQIIIPKNLKSIEIKEIESINLVNVLFENNKSNKYSLFSNELSQPLLRRFRSWKKILNNEKVSEQTKKYNKEMLFNKGLCDKDYKKTEKGNCFLENYEKIMKYKYKCLDSKEKRFYYEFKEIYNNNFLIDFLNLKICAKKSRKPISPILNLSEDLFCFLGFYCSEGYADKNKNSKKPQKRLILSAKKENNIDTKICCDKMEKVLNSLKIDFFYDGVSFCISDSTMYNVILDVFNPGVGFYEKKLPNYIFNVCKEKKESFLYGLYMGDGTFLKRSFILHTSSPNLSRDIVYLLRFLGHENITLHTEFEAIGNCSRRYIISSNNNYQLDNNEFKIKLKDNNQFNRKRNYSNLEKKPNSLVSVKKCKEVKEDEKFVYDVSVENTENFFCGIGPILAHNTIADEGLDIKRLSVLIMAGGGKSPVKCKQRVGRVIRPCPEVNKTQALVFDFNDVGKWSSEHSSMRKQILDEEEEFGVYNIDSYQYKKKKIF